MKYTVLPKSNSRKSSFAAKALLAAVITMTFSTNANAMFPDIPALIQRYTTIAQQIQEYTKQLEQYKADTEQYTALLTKIQGLGSELSLLTTGMNSQLKERALTFGIKEKCPSPGGGIPTLGSLMSTIKLNKSASLEEIKKDQHEICVQITYAQNLKYNESISVMKRMREHANLLKTKIDTSRAAAVGKDESKININTNDLRRLSADLKTSLNYSKAVVKSYDAYISSLNENQAMLTEVAMKGNQGDDGLIAAASRKLVQGAVLKGSLKVLAAKDR
jgi:hypothetical protein